MIRITAKKAGFRRAGMEHPAQAEYADGHFTEAQLAMLRAEPMLVVEEMPDTNGGNKGDEGHKGDEGDKGDEDTGPEEKPKQAEYADDHFTSEQLAMLRAEPMLVVEELPDTNGGNKGDEGDKGDEDTDPEEKPQKPQKTKKGK